MNHFVFVYGTLRSGGSQPMTTAFPTSKFVADGTVRGNLYDLGSYPGLVLDQSGPMVSGEVYEVDDVLLDELDEMELSFAYRRKQVDVSIGSETKTCWIYEPVPESYSLDTLIASGDWIEYSRSVNRAS